MGTTISSLLLLFLSFFLCLRIYMQVFTIYTNIYTYIRTGDLLLPTAVYDIRRRNCRELKHNALKILFILRVEISHLKEG